VRNRNLVQRPFLTRLIGVLVVCYLMVGILAMIAFPYLRSIKGCPANHPDTLILVTYAVVHFIVALGIGWKLRHHNRDAFSIKTEFKWSLGGLLAALILTGIGWVSFNGDPFLPCFALVVNSVTVFAAGTIWPVYLCRSTAGSGRYQPVVSQSSTNDENMDLKLFLGKEGAFQAFLRYLETEFSSENLSFWNEVNEWKTLRGKAKRDRAIAIYEKYIDEFGPFSVNVGGEMRHKAAEDIERMKDSDSEESEVEDTLFDPIQDEIYQLMMKDPFFRWKSTDQYKNFVQSSSASHRTEDTLHTLPSRALSESRPGPDSPSIQLSVMGDNNSNFSGSVDVSRRTEVGEGDGDDSKQMLVQ